MGLQRDPASVPVPLVASDEVGGDAGKLKAEPAPPPPRWRRLLRFLKRPAEFARGFLQAPMQHRANLLAADIARVLELAEELRNRTAALEGDLRGLAAFVDRSQEDSRRRLVALEALARDEELRANASESRLLARIGELEAQIGLVESRASLIAQTVGPRFDELEIKVRPLIDYDAESCAVRMADGYVMASRNDPVVLTMLADAGSGGFEPGLRQVLRRLLLPGMTAVDVGANIGLLTLACARAVGPAGLVHAFEPEPGPRSQLEKTVMQNGLAWVRVHGVAIGRSGQAGRLNVSRILGHSSLYALPDGEDAGVIEVPILTLDKALAGRPAHVVKIDVEGAELDVLAGMTRTLALSPDIAVAAEYGPSHLARVGISPGDWFAAFEAHGLVAYAVEEPAGACRRLDEAGRAALQGVLSTNLVFVRPGGAAEGRLTS